MAKTLTGTTTRPAGIIEFGSNDESVLFQDALTSTPSNGAAIGTGQQFDANGFDSNDTGAWRFDLSAAGDHNALEKAGQISIDVSSEHISTPEAYNSYNHTGSNGTAPTTLNDYLLSWSTATDTSGDSGRFFTTTDNVVSYQMEWGDSTFIPIANRYTNYGKGAYTTLTLSWSNTITTIYIDGSPHYTMNNNYVPVTDLFKYLIVGTYQNRTANAYVTSAGLKIKNLIVSKRPVMLASHPMLRNPVVMGDSFGVAYEQSTTASTTRFDHQPIYQVSAYLAKKGYRLGLPTTNIPQAPNGVSVNGSVVDDTGTASPEISAQLAGCLALNPSIVFYLGGTNDAIKTSNFSQSVFETNIKSDITTLLAAGTSVQKVFIPTIPSTWAYSIIGDTDLARTQTAAVNEVINGLRNWWDTNNPSDTGRVITYDVFSAFKGEDQTANAKYFIGSWNSNHPSYLNDLHPSSLGGRVHGRLLGEAIFKNLV